MSARKNAKHAAPSSVGPALAAGSLTAAFVVADGAAAVSSAAVSSAAVPSTVGRATATADDFARLRVCESGGDYRTDTGNGYYGAYQFAAATWRGLGYSGMPHQASAATQDAAARELQARQGWKPWPGCAKKLGLGRSSGVHAAPRKAPGRHAVPGKASRSRVTAPRTAPVLERTISLADRRSYRLVVAQWQARMAQRGWTITVDGHFGPQSASVARRFAAEKGLRLPAAATVDRALYTAAWTAPVT